MNIFKSAVLSLLACTLPLCGTQAIARTFIPASSPEIAYMGRTSERFQPDGVAFTYPGTSILAHFEGTSLSMAVKPGSGDFMVEVDDQLPLRVHFGETDSLQVLAEGLPDTTHSVRVMYAIEGHELRPVFRGFYLDEGKHLGPKPELPSRRIEFIGNSITCGYGIESENRDAPFTYATENHYYTYAALTARALHAQHVAVARSGIGVYRNYGSPVSGSPECMPAMYGRTLFLDSTELWDPARYVPDVVCVNLGTNDVSENKYDLALLTDAYRKFVAHLRDIYPKAKLVLLTGCMLNGRQLDDVKATLDKVTAERRTAGDNEVYRFDMSPQTGSLGYAPGWHPTMRQHRKMATELTAYLKELMNW